MLPYWSARGWLAPETNRNPHPHRLACRIDDRARHRSRWSAVHVRPVPVLRAGAPSQHARRAQHGLQPGRQAPGVRNRWGRSPQPCCPTYTRPLVLCAAMSPNPGSVEHTPEIMRCTAEHAVCLTRSRCVIFASPQQDWSSVLCCAQPCDACHAVPCPVVLCCTPGDSIIYIWDTATGELATQLAGHSTAVRAVAYSNNGAMLASAAGERE